ncbi:MAG: hypothetical protein B7C24_06070 [Bacteroidetes bacterium 4572_77]|nr:MAG: hypothetical protein B7C24_06070 [Bacteroidetes bacterium 4572_77]
MGFLFTSCQEDDPKPQDDGSILIRSNVSGDVKLFDQYGEKSAQNDMRVTMDNHGKFFYGDTEKDGGYLVLNADYFPNYTILFEKQGYGTYKILNYSHEYNNGGEGHINEVPNLSEKSGTYSTSISANVSNDTVFFDLTAQLASGSGTRIIRFLFHTTPQISNEIFAYYTGQINIYSPTQTYYFTKIQLEGIGLKPNTKYYVQAYGDSYYSNSYMDTDGLHLPNLGIPTTGDTPTDSFIMP